MGKISFPGGGGGGGHSIPVDSRAATGDIIPNSSGGHNIGTTALPFDNVVAVSGQFPSGVVVVDANGSGWLITVSTIGELTTSGPIVIG